jgi:hypothetical protein
MEPNATTAIARVPGRRRLGKYITDLLGDALPFITPTPMPGRNRQLLAGSATLWDKVSSSSFFTVAANEQR